MGPWRHHKEDIRIDMTISYDGGEEVSVDIAPGDKIGFKVTEFEVSEDLIDAINETIFEGELTEENVTEMENMIMGSKWVFERNTTNEIYDSGLDILYNLTVAIPDGEAESGYFLSNVMLVGSPYIIPEWDLVFSQFQLYAHIALKVYPKFMKYMAAQEDPNIIFDFTGDYQVLSYGDNEYVSAYVTFDADLGYRYTIPAEYKNKTDVSLSGEGWYTYDADGYLTEIHVSLGGEITVDSNGDNVTDPDVDEHYSGTISITINRVGTSATGEPLWNSPVDAPDPTAAGWTDVTPYKTIGGEGLIPETIAGIPTTYIVVGVGVLFILSIIVLIKRR